MLIYTPVPAPALFTDQGLTTSVGNILFENVHVVAAYNFWVQSGDGTMTGKAPTYGNIRFVNTDVYAIYIVFDWSNVREVVSFSNFLSNPSLCNGGSGGCPDSLKNWTGDHGIWFHVNGGISVEGNQAAVGGVEASNLTVTGYLLGILIDSNGHLDEAIFGSTTVFDQVPRVLFVNDNGSITHTVFSSKVEFAGRSRGLTAYSNPAFELHNPQAPLSTDLIRDHNTIDLNGVTTDGVGGELFKATVTTGDIGSITIVGANARGYCSGPGTTSDAVYIDTPNNSTQSTALVIADNQITTSKAGCGGLNLNTHGAPYYPSNNFVGVYPLN